MLLTLKFKLKQSNNARACQRIHARALEVLGEKTVRAVCDAHPDKAFSVLLSRMQDREARLAARRRQQRR